MRFLLPALASLLAALPAWAHEPGVRAGGELLGMIEADARGNLAEVQRLSLHGRARWDRDRVQVQLHLIEGVDPEAVTDAMLTPFQGRAGDRGLTVLDAWLPIRQIPLFLTAHPEVEHAQLPNRPWSWTGPVTSQGATQLRTAQLTCLADDATGVTVAVVDEGFTHLSDSIASGETQHVVKPFDETGGVHGSMCCEVVADVAPGATLLPVRTDTLAAIQKLAKEIAQKGNPRHIDVISHSVGWFGMSFGRHEGPLCAVTDLVTNAGVAWVNASGNNGGGSFYTGAYVDADGDGKQDFQPGQPRLIFHQWPGGSVQANLDWDDYADRKQDFDLVLERLDSTGDAQAWVQVDTSTVKQGKYSAPIEQVYVPDAPGGIYALQAVCKANCKPGIHMRIVNLGGGAGSFSVTQDNGNVYDPGSCKGVLTVGALFHGHYTKPPLENYSSFGPTVDGRQKPEVVAPTGVATSFGDFYGTSAACPHTAGTVALYIARGFKPLDAVQAVIRDAVQMGVGHPDEAFGWGRIQVRSQSLGWECESQASGIPAEVTCVTACGSVGTHACDTGCRFTTCTPPAEVCNGLDDDCDGNKDEGFACALGGEGTCTTSCGTVGTRTCGSGCVWGSCSTCATLDAGGGMDAGVVKVALGHDPPGGGCSARPVGGFSWLWAAFAGAGLLGWRRRRGNCQDSWNSKSKS
jgi:hypothetical protein